MKVISTLDVAAIKPFIDKIYQSPVHSHKGQNGKLLIIGGSSLFHSASIWAAEIASHVVDMVHYCSTKENAEVMTSLKKKFQNGIVIRQEDLPTYITEDDILLVGPGMMRGKMKSVFQNLDFSDILKTQKKNEYDFTYYFSQYLFSHYPTKKYVLDAGVLQMMNKNWLLQLKTKPILTPHIKEFAQLFGLDLSMKNRDEIISLIVSIARQYHCILMVKMIDDVVTDGNSIYIVKGGNAGLTKGGTGDILAGLTASFYTHSDPLTSALVSSFILKSASNRLYQTKGTWYNNDDLIDMIPRVLNQMRKSEV